MKILPIDKFTIQSNMSASALADALRIELERDTSILTHGDGGCYQGYVAHDYLRLTKTKPLRNTFEPVVEGVISSHGSGSIISINMGLYGVIVILLCVLLLSAIVVLLSASYQVIFLGNQIPPSFFLLLLLLLAITWVVPSVLFWPKAKHLKLKMFKLFNTIEPNQSVDPTRKMPVES